MRVTTLLLALASCHQADPRLAGTWAVRRIEVDGVPRDWGQNRYFVRFDVGTLQVLQCAYANHLDLSFAKMTADACPVRRLNCTHSIRLREAIDGVLQYEVAEEVPTCRSPDGHGVASGPACGVSPRPRAWPFAGHSDSKYRVDGNRLSLASHAGSDRQSTAAITLERVAGVPLAWSGSCSPGDNPWIGQREILDGGAVD